MHDLVLRGGTIVDGTGAPARTGDVAVDGSHITQVGEVDGRGRREVAVAGALVTPGWVDIHTHYDGQATWDDEMAPSSWHGVTTAVMGSCGVGFAPVRPGSEDFLVELMEGVEDIPGTALHEGLSWGWETFADYLSVLAARRRTLDVGALVPHAAVRAYVLGDRAHADAVGDDELREIGAVVAGAVEVGALGFSTSRTSLHRSRHGLVPGTYAGDAELVAIASSLAAVGGAVVQFVSDGEGGDDRDWVRAVARLPNVTVTYSLAPPLGGGAAASLVDRALEAAHRAQRAGRRVIPQVPARPVGMLFGLQTSLHPFSGTAAFDEVARLNVAEQVSGLRDGDRRRRILAEVASRSGASGAGSLRRNWAQIFPLGDPPEYEPRPGDSAAAVAAAQRRSPAEVVLDWMLEEDGRALLFAPLGAYGGDLDLVRAMLGHPASISGLSDGGAHCGLICDASFPTYLLTHWTRDRSRGDHLPIELVVHKQTGATAAAFGLVDRGVLAPGRLADMNVVDHASLRLHRPRLVHDLPAAGRRLVQSVDGYVTTVKSGRVTFEHGEPTGELPGGVVRRRRAD
jgi:N-acyl-D-amino-acid deacylase